MEEIEKILIDEKIISAEVLEEVKEIQRNDASEKQRHRKTIDILIEKRFIDEKKVLKFLADKFGLSYVDLDSYDNFPKEVIELIPISTAEQLNVFPISILDEKLTVAISDPTAINEIYSDIRFRTGYEVNAMLASTYKIKNAIEKFSSQFETEEPYEDIVESIDELEDTSEEQPKKRLVENIISEGVYLGASDIHIESFEKEIKVRYRVDGVLREGKSFPKSLQNVFAATIKTMARLRIDIKRTPQSSRIKKKVGNEEIDLRVSILPCIYGEKIVMRILYKNNLLRDLTKLGFESPQLNNLNRAIESLGRVILITGPNSSGKTSTLYSIISKLNKTDVNIMTVENPVEYSLRDINQVQIKPKIGLTYESALNAILMQDSDVIMIDEIEDDSIAKVAMKTALTNHLVLASLTASDINMAIERLVAMHIDPFLIASSLTLIVNQRIIRRVCPDCEEAYLPSDEELKKLHISKEELKNATIKKGKGCPNCTGTGYKGRFAIYEVMPITRELKEMIMAGNSGKEIREKAIKNRMLTISDCARLKLLKGETTLEEIIRVIDVEDE